MEEEMAHEVSQAEPEDPNTSGSEGPEERSEPGRKDLKLRMPEYKGKKGGDPQVHVQAFESWAVFRELPRGDWKVCFPQTLRDTAQKWYFNYPPDKIPTYKMMSKAALVQRFKDKKSDEELLSQLGRIKQKRAGVRQFVEEIKDLVRQLSSPLGNKSLRAWFINGTALKSVAKSKITNPTKTFEELIQRAVRLERKGSKRKRTGSSSGSSSSDSSSSLEEERVEKSKTLKQELKKLKGIIGQLSGVRTDMPSKKERWCVGCRDSSHSTNECIKCNFYERRGPPTGPNKGHT